MTSALVREHDPDRAGPRSASASAITNTTIVTAFPVEGAWDYLGFFLWSPVLNLFWLTAFVWFALGRLGAARVLAVLGALGGAAMAVVPYVIGRIHGTYILPFGAHDASRYGWLAVSVAAVLLARAPCLCRDRSGWAPTWPARSSWCR